MNCFHNSKNRGWRPKLYKKCELEMSLKSYCVVFFLVVTCSIFVLLSLSLQQLPVITSNTIVRCRSCRTYINPFVTFLDQRRWKCNLCYRVNDGMSPICVSGFLCSYNITLCGTYFVRRSSWPTSILSRLVPDEFMYNPVTRSYGEPHKRPEVQNSTVEFIASSDYMVSCLSCSLNL